MTEQMAQRLQAETASDSRGYATDHSVRYAAIAAAATDMPLAWWTPYEDVAVQSLASVSDLLDASSEKGR